MSALPPKADIETQSRDVRFVPKADIERLALRLVLSPLQTASALTDFDFQPMGGTARAMDACCANWWQREKLSAKESGPGFRGHKVR